MYLNLFEFVGKNQGMHPKRCCLLGFRGEDDDKPLDLGETHGRFPMSHLEEKTSRRTSAIPTSLKCNEMPSVVYLYKAGGWLYVIHVIQSSLVMFGTHSRIRVSQRSEFILTNQ